MAYQCEICDKKSHQGRQHTHHTGVAGGQWKKRAQTTIRSFRPNLHWISMPINGVMTRVHACTRCIKRVKFNNQQINKINKLTNENYATSSPARLIV